MSIKIRKIVLIIIMSFSILSCLTIKSNATNHRQNYNVAFKDTSIGDKFVLSKNEYDRDGFTKLFCIEHEDSLSRYSYHTYKVVNKITIEGSRVSGTAKDGTYISIPDSKISAKLAAAVHYASAGSQRRNAVWYYMYDWVKAIQSEFKGVSTKYVKDKNEGLNRTIRNRVNNYVKRLNKETTSADAYIKDNSGTIEVEKSEENNTKYVKIGPYNLDFEPELDSIVVKGKRIGNSNEITVNNVKFKQSGKLISNASEIDSGVKFYILIPLNKNIEEITRIDLKTKQTTPENLIKAYITFLKTGNGNEAWQNLSLIRTKSEGGGKPESKSLTLPKQKLLGNIIIKKIDKNNNTITLNGVGFKVKNNDTNLWIKKEANGVMNYVSNESEATEFITRNNGTIPINNVIVGDYEAKETTMPYYGYEMVYNDKNKTVVKGCKTSTMTIENEQKYINLGGYVWLDVVAGKADTRNDLYDNGETRVSGVEVHLMEGTTILKTAYTDSNGSYQFNEVLTENLGKYHIEFIYNGLTYTNVIPHIDVSNGSKAAENATTRTNFNKQFNVIENAGSQTTGVAKDTSDKTTYNLNYNIADHKATLNDRYTINQFTINNANTNETGYSILNEYNTLKANGTIIDRIDNINLGLYEREQPDLAIVKDVQNVKLSINGKEHIYEYAQRFNHPDAYEYNGDTDMFNVGVKWKSGYASQTYSRAIYKSDYTCTAIENTDRELKVYITYKIGIKNESTSVTAKVNDIVDYYSSTYEFDSSKDSLVGAYDDYRDGNVAGNRLNVKKSNGSNGYDKAIIDTNLSIDAQHQENVYLVFKLDKDDVLHILGDEESNTTATNELLYNTAEINSYSIYKDGNPYAGIDKDSAPGNMTLGNEDTYEDDTDRAPGFKLEAADAREMTGTVFYDETSGKLLTGQVRQGDSIFNDNEKGISRVNIKLIETSGTGVVYYYNNETNSFTDENGNFRFTGFIPGDYEVQYEWGGQTVNGRVINVQDYKGTVYDKTRDTENKSNKDWYKGTGKNDPNTRYSDAIDDYKTRQEIDEEIKEVKNDSVTTKEKMISTTHTMGIGVEYQTTFSASSGDKYIYQIKNIDFGIVERARQNINVTKRVESMRIVLRNGQVITDVTFDENGNINGQKDHMVYLPPDMKTLPDDQNIKTSRGTIKVELDNELLQGARAEIGYAIEFNNNSELDYLTEQFYKFGEQGGESVKIGLPTVIDYLDSDWSFETDKNGDNWKMITLEELKLDNSIVISDNVTSNKDENADEDINSRIILKTDKLSEKIAPNTKNKVMLNVSKILTSTEDITLDNETETIQVSKTGGSKIPTIPGNYKPGTMELETDGSVAETLIITPSTGGNLAFVLPVVIGIVALVILGSGIFIIKKKVIDIDKK